MSSLEHLCGPGSIAMWDQGYAAAHDQLSRCSAFVLVTVDRETRQVDFAALSCDLPADGMIALLESAIEGAEMTIPELEEVSG